MAPPVVGAAYVLGLAAWTWQRGVDEAAVAGDVARTKLAIALCAVGTGLLLGLFCEVLLRSRTPRPRLMKRSAAGTLVETALLVAAVHALFVLWGMAAIPQLYAERWYAKGVLPRTVQIFATDVLGPRGVVVLALALAVAFVRPSRLAYLARRALGAVRALLRRRLPALGVTLAGALATLLAVTVLARAPSPIAEAHAEEPPREETSPRMNVLLLAAGSLRADRIDPRVTPALSALAERGTKLERAYVSLPSTPPSAVTILTGLHPHHHGVRSVVAPAKELDTLPRRFAAAGYVTGVVGDRGSDVFGRIDLGLSRIEIPAIASGDSPVTRVTPLLPVLQSQLGRRLFPAMQRVAEATDASLVADDVVAALRSMRGKPFFLAALFSSACAPYASPDPYYSRFAQRSYRGRFKYHAAADEIARGAKPNADDIRQIRALYDGAVSSIDDAFARVLAALDRLGLDRETIVVVTSDHGEALFDGGHGHGHGEHLFGDEGTHVPLLVYDPRISPRPGGGRRERRIVRDVDIAPTLYELAGVEPPPSLDGRSFAPALRGEPIDERHAFAETDVWRRDDIAGLPSELRIPYVLGEETAPITVVAKHRMVRDERYKLVYVPTRSAVRYMLFDTQLDPGETTDVASARPEVVTRLRAELWKWMLEDPLVEQKSGWVVPRVLPHGGREAR